MHFPLFWQGKNYWKSVVREELLMIATHTTCQKRQWQRLFPRRMMIHHEVVSHPKNIASGRFHCICQFWSFIRKNICLVECPTCITFSHFWGKNYLILDYWAGERFKKSCKNIYPCLLGDFSKFSLKGYCTVYTKSFVFEAAKLLLKSWSLGFDAARLLFSIKYHKNHTIFLNLIKEK